MRQSQILRGLSFVLALLLVTLLIHQMGPRQILGHLSRVGGGIGFVFFLGFPRFFLNTLGWRVFLPKRAVSLLSLYRLKIAGELLTRVTPLHFVGGDAARIFLMEKVETREKIAASVLMDRTAITLGGAFFVLTGVLFGSFLLPIPREVQGILGAFMLLILFSLAFLITQQKKGMLESGLRLLSPQRLQKWRGKCREVDATVKKFYEEGHGKLLTATFLNYLARGVAAAEIYLLFHLLQIPLSPLHAVMFLSLSLLLTAALFIVPGTLGIAEGTYGFFFHLLKFDPAIGVSLELSRKLNGILWYAFGGLLALFFKKTSAERVLSLTKDESKH